MTYKVSVIGTLVSKEDIINIRKPVSFACVGKHPKYVVPVYFFLKKKGTQKMTISFRMISARKGKNSSKKTTSNMKCVYMRVFHMVITSSLPYRIYDIKCYSGFGVYGSYSEEHIKAAQKQVFRQFLDFMSKH